MMFSLARFVAITALSANILASAYTVDPPTKAPSDTVSDCTDWRVAQKSDTCQTLAQAGQLTLDQLYAYNPSLAAKGCPIIEGDSYCIEENFGIPPAPTTTTSTTTTTAGNGVTTPTPTQPGMAKNCNKFHKVASGDTCSDLASGNGIKIDDFYAWNPAVGKTCSTLLLDFYVCVGIIGQSPTPTTTTTTTPGNGIVTPTPTQSMVGNCNKFYQVQSGDTCIDIASKSGISLENFYSWNPGVHNDCSLLFLGYYVCVGIVGGPTAKPTTTTTTTTTTKPTNGVSTPTPTQSGMVNNCNTFYLVKTDDSCADIAKAKGIPLDKFYSWNPAIKSDCSGLWVGYYVCVNIIGGTTSTTMTTSTTKTVGNGVPTPTPIQSGMVTNCKTFHQVASGDECQVIADQAHISLNDFYSWNPGVGRTCSSLWLGYYVCVGLI